MCRRARASKDRAGAETGGHLGVREELRRFPRLPSRCRAWIRDRYGVWDAETEDISPRGCRIVTPRPQTVGTLVRLVLISDRIAEPLAVAGLVVWVEKGPQNRAGISFAGSASGDPAAGEWVRTLGAAEPGASGEAAPGAAATGDEPPLDIVVAPPEPVDARPEAMAARLLARARELVADGCAPAASVLLERARSLSPEDPEIARLLRECAPPPPAPPGPPDPAER